MQLPEELRTMTCIPQDVYVSRHGLNYGPDDDGWIGFDTLHAWDHWPIDEIAPYIFQGEVTVLRLEEQIFTGADDRIEWTLENLVQVTEALALRVASYAITSRL
ncbi:hypothetical protein O1L60_30755 [Streptomyces diastatochromogenes]|nr:hypothetical protein [Streptomyces diastatochromogenes]